MRLASGLRAVLSVRICLSLWDNLLDEAFPLSPRGLNFIGIASRDSPWVDSNSGVVRLIKVQMLILLAFGSGHSSHAPRTELDISSSPFIALTPRECTPAPLNGLLFPYGYFNEYVACRSAVRHLTSEPDT